MEPIIIETVIPQMVAFKSVMVLRNIQLRKAREAKHEKEKAEREGGPVGAQLDKKTTMKNMTEEEIVA